MAAQVFISHSSKDRKVARTICTALESRGLTCWIASRDVGPGESFMDAIVRAIRAAKVMVLVFSENANNSDEIKREVVLAGNAKVTVIPVRVEDVLPGDAFAYQFATRQWIDLFEDWENQVERLATWIAGIVATGSADSAATPKAETKAELQQSVLDAPTTAADFRQQEDAAQQRAEAERKRREEEAKRREEEARRKAAEAQSRERAEQDQRQREAEAKQSRAEAERRRAEEQRVRNEAAAKRRAEEEERHQQRRTKARPLWPPSRPMLVGGSLVGVAVVAAIAVWLGSSPSGPVAPAQITLAPLSPAQESALKPGDTFQECSKCPVMKVVPAGSFTMGSPASEPGRIDDEGPQQTVAIAGQFAVAQYELTFAEWDACVADGGCFGYKPDDEGWGRGTRPVINVSWDDANAYVAWLAKKTGRPYRLPSESEYEYATRAGTTTAYPWGDAIGKNNANCLDCGSQWDGQQTAPVGSFAANGFGLYDTVGNVSEWTEDCYHNSYNGAPTDGSAWTASDCSIRVVRGGNWDLTTDGLRSAVRSRYSADYRINLVIGFRVGRTLLTP